MLRSDATLHQDVMSELACDAICKSANVEVRVKNGVVVLTGTVATESLKMSVYRAVQRVFGVDGIDQRLEIVPVTAVVAAIGREGE